MFGLSTYVAYQKFCTIDRVSLCSKQKVYCFIVLVSSPQVIRKKLGSRLNTFLRSSSRETYGDAKGNFGNSLLGTIFPDRIKGFNFWKSELYKALNCYLKLSSLLKNFLAEEIEAKSQSNESWVVKLGEGWDQHSNSEMKSSTCVYMCVLMANDNSFF